MDVIAAIAATPLSVAVPYLTFAISLATALLLLLPAPTTASSPAYVTIFNLVHLIANLKSAPVATAAEPAKPAATPIPPAAAALLLLLAVGAVIACTPAQTAQAQQIATVVCQDDAAVQPVVSTVALTGMAGATVAGIAATDQALVHPLVVDACKSISATAKPVSVSAN